MDTIKILLAITTTLLLAALAWSWQQQRDASKNAPSLELARITQQIAELEREEAIIQTEKQLRELGVTSDSSPSPLNPTAATQVELENKAAKLREIEARNAALQAELEMKEKEAKLAKQEGGLIAQRDLEKSDRELRRARQISEALLMAKVMEFVNDPNTGSFVTIQLVMPEHVTVDTVLAVRRKDGIAGNVKVREIVGGEAIADVLPGIGPFAPQPGDELIVPPAF
ncbi:MAG: hypothetical protein RL117_1460 [Verrucomicrobiota bacterium]